VINRIQPLLPVQAYKTYGIAAPRATHSRPATCAEVNCPAWKNGWKTIVPSVGVQADYIRGKTHGRHYTENSAPGGLAEFVFPPGQPCFRSSQHTTTLHREPIFTLRGGDWRGQTSAPLRMRSEDWLDSFATNQQAIKDRKQRG
jgi:hypothetical protein